MPGATGLQGYHPAHHRCCRADKSRPRDRPSADVHPTFNLPHINLTLHAADLLGSCIQPLLQLLLLLDRVAVIVDRFLAEGLQAAGLMLHNRCSVEAAAALQRAPSMSRQCPSAS